MDTHGILIGIFIISPLIYAIFKWLALRSLDTSELEIYKADKHYGVLTLTVLGVIGFIVLIFNSKADWALILGVGLVLLSILEATLHIRKVKNILINDSAKKKLILAEPFFILFTIAITASILLF